MKTKDWIYIGIIGILIILLIVIKSNPKPADVLKQHQIDSLTTEIKKRDIMIDSSESKVKYMQSTLKDIDNNIKSNNEKSTIIYKQYQIKIIPVDSYDVTDIERFFSERYGQDSL